MTTAPLRLGLTFAFACAWLCFPATVHCALLLGAMIGHWPIYSMLGHWSKLLGHAPSMLSRWFRGGAFSVSTVFVFWGLLFLLPTADAVMLGSPPVPDPPKGVNPEQHAAILQILSAFDGDGDSGAEGIQTLCRRLLGIFATLGWMKKLKLAPDAVGTDPSNRNGLGVVVQDVYELGGDILETGWDDTECAGAICIEMESHDDNNTVKQFSEKVVRESNGRLPPIVTEQLRYGALAGNHTVLFLRCVLHQMPAKGESLERICLDGKLNVDLLKERDSRFALRVVEGMEWEVLSFKVEQFYGSSALGLISEARNVGSQLARRENTFQVLARIFKVCQNSQGTESIDWAHVKKTVLRSKPPCAPYIQDLIAFVVSSAGGKSGWALEWLIRIFRANSLGSARRELDPKYWSAVACGVADPETPALKCALILDNITGPEESIQAGGICNYRKVGDISALFGKVDKELLRDGEKFLRVTLLVLKQIDHLDRGRCEIELKGATRSKPCSTTPEFCSLMVAKRTVAFLLDKQKKTGEAFLSFEGIGHQYLEDLALYCPDVRSHCEEAGLEVFGWEEDKAPAAAGNHAELSAVAHIPLAEASLQGGTTDVLHSLRYNGYDLRMHVKSRNSEDLWEIDSLVMVDGAEQEQVNLKELPDKPGAATAKKTLKEFLDEFCHPKAGYENKLLHTWAALPHRRAETSAAWALSVAKADIQVMLRTIQCQYPDEKTNVAAMLNLLNAPQGLQSQGYIAQSHLVLVPLTSTIRQRDKTKVTPKEIDPSPFECKYHDGQPGSADLQYYLLKQQGGFQDTSGDGDEKDDKVEKVALFWRVKPVHKEEDANMTVEHVKVNFLSHISSEPPSVNKSQAKSSDPDHAAASVMETSTRTVLMSIPVLVNHKDLMEGDKLAYYVKKEENAEDKEKRVDNKRLLAQAFAAGSGRRSKAKKGLPGQK